MPGANPHEPAFDPYGDPRVHTVTRRECPICHNPTAWSACDGHGRPDGKSATGTAELTYTLLGAGEIETLAAHHREQAATLSAREEDPQSARLEPDQIAEWAARAAWHRRRAEHLDRAGAAQRARQQSEAVSCSHLIVTYVDGTARCALCPAAIT